MDERSAQVATTCECIDHCLAYAMWCDDFARYVDAEDMVMGFDRGFDIVSDATRLQSFLALRKLDDFLGGVKPKADDLVAANFQIDVPSVLGDLGAKFLSTDERDNVNKGAAHLTEKLTLDADSEVDLQAVIKRSLGALSRLVAALRKEAAYAEAKAVIERWNEQLIASRDILWSPTIRAARIAETPWLDVFCPGCSTGRAIDLRKVERHPLASVATLALRCSWCPASAPMPRILGLHALPPAAAAKAAARARHVLRPSVTVHVLLVRTDGLGSRTGALHRTR
jgi:hypothetical protein